MSATMDYIFLIQHTITTICQFEDVVLYECII